MACGCGKGTAPVRRPRGDLVDAQQASGGKVRRVYGRDPQTWNGPKPKKNN